MRLQLFVVLFLLLAAIQCICRPGSGESYQSPSSSIPAEMPAEKTVSDSIGADSTVRPDSKSENAAQLFKDTKVKESDYNEFRWFGILGTAFLLASAAGITIAFSYSADRQNSIFFRDRFLPLLYINGSVLLLTWPVLRAFSLPQWSLVASFLLTASVLTADGILSLKGSGQSIESDGQSGPITRTNPAELKKFDLMREDKWFSLILLTDFVHAMYHGLLSRIGSQNLCEIKPFLCNEAIADHEYFARNSITVREIVVGAIKLEKLQKTDSEWQAEFCIKSNYTTTQENHTARLAAIEKWLFARAANVQSPATDHMRRLCCPACGAPARFSLAGRCGHCNENITAGSAHWYLKKRIVEKVQKPIPGTHFQEEAGTTRPTILSPFLQQATIEFCQKRSIDDWSSWWEKFCDSFIRPSFMLIYDAWSGGRWEKARHLLTDRIFETCSGQIAHLASQGLFNRLESVAIEKIILVKLSSDNIYQAMTVRIFAQCLDYLANSQNQIIAGSNSSPRNFSEYWTFIRSVDAPPSAEMESTDRCPCCGAPADKMSMSAECGYCHTIISNARHCWVLALITQDEDYDG